MPNAVYNMIVQSLAQSISERAADAMLRAALNEHRFDPEEITAAQMQIVLSGPLVNRLSVATSPERARQEVRELSYKVSRQYPRAVTLFTDVGELKDWEQPKQGPEAWHGLGDLSSMTLEAEEVIAADDFEFDDPDYAAPQHKRLYHLDLAGDQDALIRDLGRMQGVQGVLVSRENGELLKVKTMRDASHLGSVIAATAMLFRAKSLKLMSADLGQQIICMRPAHGYCVTVIAGANINTGRLLSELQAVELSLSGAKE